MGSVPLAFGVAIWQEWPFGKNPSGRYFSVLRFLRVGSNIIYIYIISFTLTPETTDGTVMVRLDSGVSPPPPLAFSVSSTSRG